MNNYKPLKRSWIKRGKSVLKRSWIKKGKSPRKKSIDKVKAVMKQLLRAKYGNVCFFCGKPESYFKYPLSLFHILPVSRYPKLECEIENTVLACWSKEYYYHTCHNDWEDRVEPRRSKMEQKLLLVLGADYETALKIQDKIIPKLNEQRAEFLLEYYRKKAI